MKLTAILLCLFACSAIAAPDIPVTLDGAKYCATARQADNFTGVASGACTVPPVTVLANQLKTSAISYGPYVLTARAGVDVTEWNNIWGHANTTDVLAPWPGRSGAAPVIRNFSRDRVLAAHFKTSATFAPGFYTYARNWSSGDLLQYGIDICISKVKGDFTPNGGSCAFNQFPIDNVVLSYKPAQLDPKLPPANPLFYAVLSGNTDYYLNIRASLLTGPSMPLYVVKY